jgi:hypothetical protein
MVLADLGRKLNSALAQFSRSSVIDLEVDLHDDEQHRSLTPPL